MVDKTDIEQALKNQPDPYLGADLVTAKAVKSLEVDGGTVKLALQLGFPAANYESELRRWLTDLVTSIDGVDKLDLTVASKIVAHEVQKSLGHMTGVKNIIAVASGKGGVGKSTVAANLALALQAEGANAALLDADIYGPSQTRMMGMSGKPQASKDNKIEPMRPYGVQCMSIGLMIDEETPMIWRGPMVTQALQQLLNDTQWDDVDYLVIDLPPGTGDIQLTLAQKVPVSGAVIVTTPQDIALLDARKALKMFEKVEVPVLGIIENMSAHICSHCGHSESIFGDGGGKRMAQQYGIDLLGELPLAMSIREQADGGAPTVVSEPDGEVTKVFCQVARKITARLSQRGKDYSGVFPKIVVEND